MKRRFYFILVVFALVLLAIPGFAANAANRAARPAHRFAYTSEGRSKCCAPLNS
jgi:hypothetical protein